MNGSTCMYAKFFAGYSNNYKFEEIELLISEHTYDGSYSVTMSLNDEIQFVFKHVKRKETLFDTTVSRMKSEAWYNVQCCEIFEGMKGLRIRKKKCVCKSIFVNSIMRKPVFRICETKAKNRETDQRLCFRYFLNPKFQASSFLLWLYSPVCAGPRRKPLRHVILMAWII